MRILVAEKDPATRSMLEERLTEWGYQVVVCENGAQVWEAVQEKDPPNFAVVDLDMPGMDGRQICFAIRELKKRPHMYMILSAPPNREADVVAALESGMDDFLVKPIDPLQLQVKIRAGSRIVRLQRVFISFLDHYDSHGVSDPLTGLWNNHAIINILARELARSVREGTSIGLLNAELDRWSGVEGPSGKLTDDSLRREVTRRIHSSVRSYDTVGLGKDKSFVIVAPGCDYQNVRQLAERIHSSIGRCRVSVAGQEIQLTMSLGAVSVDGGKVWDTDSVMKAGEEALEAAKKKGGNRVEFWVEAS
jgi:two-component system, cell cycle response regulator